MQQSESRDTNICHADRDMNIQVTLCACEHHDNQDKAHNVHAKAVNVCDIY